MSAPSRLSVRFKDAVNTPRGHKATVATSVLDDHAMVRLALLQKGSEGLTSIDLTLGQATRLRSILDAAIAAASIAPADAQIHADGAARGAAGEVARGGRSQA